MRAHEAAPVRAVAVQQRCASSGTVTGVARIEAIVVADHGAGREEAAGWRRHGWIRARAAGFYAELPEIGNTT